MKKLRWFKRTGIIFMPVSVAGWLILLAAVAYAVYSFVEIDRRSHSASDTLMNFAFRALIILVVYLAIATLTSRE